MDIFEITQQINFKSKPVIAIIAMITIAVSIIGYAAIKKQMGEEIHVVDIPAGRNIGTQQGSIDKPETADSNRPENETKEIWVHVTGSVKNPGPVRLKEGQRIKDAVEAAGGVLPDADIDAVNMVYVLKDGNKIFIPSKKTAAAPQEPVYYSVQPVQDAGSGVVEENTGVLGEKSSAADEKKMININTASKEELEQLTGIGPSTADKIIEYRKKSGEFKKIDDIMNVHGIGQSKFDKIKDRIITE